MCMWVLRSLNSFSVVTYDQYELYTLGFPFYIAFKLKRLHMYSVFYLIKLSFIPGDENIGLLESDKGNVVLPPSSLQEYNLKLK